VWILQVPACACVCYSFSAAQRDLTETALLADKYATPAEAALGQAPRYVLTEGVLY